MEQFQKDAVSVRTEIKQIGVMRHAFTSISGVKYEFTSEKFFGWQIDLHLF